MAITERYKTTRNPETGKREAVYETDRTGRVKVGKDGKPRKKIIGYRVDANSRDPITGKQRRKVVGTFLRKEDAKRADERARVDIQNGTFKWEEEAPRPVITVSVACRTWLGTKKDAVSTNSYNQYESIIRVHIEPAVGDRDIEGLTRTDVQDLVNAWRDGTPPAVKQLKPRLLELCLMVLKAALEWQVDAGYLQSNPALRVTKPRVEKRRRLDLWTQEETGKFVSLAEKDHLAPLWALCLYEGFRRGEALGLRWRDLHWSDDEGSCVAHITQTVIADLEGKGGPKIQSKAKTTGSEKPVQLTQATIRVLRAHRDRQKFLRRELGEAWNAGDLIVTSTIGTVVWPTNVDHALRALCERAGVRYLNIHALRHMAATTMLRAGMSPALVQQKLRHADIQTTVQVYGHLMTTDQEQVNTALDAEIDKAIKAAATLGE